MTYRTTKLYVAGPLKGTTVSVETEVRYIQARRYRDQDGKYVVASVELIAPGSRRPPTGRRPQRRRPAAARG